MKGGYGLSVWIGSEVKHYLVQKHPEGYGIQDGLRFQTISALLQHYHDERVISMLPLQWGLHYSLNLNVLLL